MHVGKRLRRLIKDRGIKQNWLSARAGIATNTLQSILDDKCAPSAQSLAKISAALGVSTDWILGLKDEAS